MSGQHPFGGPTDPAMDPRTDPHGFPAVGAEHDPGDLAALALALLPADRARAVETHVAGCAACRTELAALRTTASTLRTVPPEMFVEGPPDSDLLARRAVRAAHQETAAFRRRRRLLQATAAVVAAVALAGGGALVGRVSSPEPAVVAAPEGTVTVQGTAPASDGGEISMSATIGPARGWVRVSTFVRGIPADENCRIMVLAADGSAHEAASWLTSPRGHTDGTQVDGATIVDPEQVEAVMIRDADGTDLITVPV